MLSSLSSISLTSNTIDAFNLDSNHEYQLVERDKSDDMTIVLGVDCKKNPPTFIGLHKLDALEVALMDIVSNKGDMKNKKSRSKLADVQYGDKGVLKPRAVAEAAHAWLNFHGGSSVIIDMVEQRGQGQADRSSKLYTRRYQFYDEFKKKMVIMRTLPDMINRVTALTGRNFWNDMMTQPNVYDCQFTTRHFVGMGSKRKLNEVDDVVDVGDGDVGDGGDGDVGDVGSGAESDALADAMAAGAVGASDSSARVGECTTGVYG